MDEPRASLSLADYRRRTHEIYAAARHSSDEPAAWRKWRADRDELFGRHPQSPLSPADRTSFGGLTYFGHDPSWRMTVSVRRVEAQVTHIAHSGEGSSPFRRFGVVDVVVDGVEASLELYWLEAYGGGIFLPFRDATSGDSTYGGGRYLLDTVKGADLGRDLGGRIVLDFNYAYHPSCVHDDRWSCPLAPPANRLPFPVAAGERLP